MKTLPGLHTHESVFELIECEYRCHELLVAEAERYDVVALRITGDLNLFITITDDQEIIVRSEGHVEQHRETPHEQLRGSFGIFQGVLINVPRSGRKRRWSEYSVTQWDCDPGRCNP